MGHRLTARQLWSVLQRSGAGWWEHRGPSMGAALSYYTLFSLSPMLLVVITVAGRVYGEDKVHGVLLERLGRVMGTDAAGAIQTMLASAGEPSDGLGVTALGLVVLLIGATSAFGELQDALDQIWRAPAASQRQGLWTLLKSRFLAFIRSSASLRPWC